MFHDKHIPCTCGCHDSPGILHCFPCCAQCYEQRNQPPPDRPPPHSSSPFRWTWSDQELKRRDREYLAAHEPPQFLDVSIVYATADRSAFKPREPLRYDKITLPNVPMAYPQFPRDANEQ